VRATRSERTEYDDVRRTLTRLATLTLAATLAGTGLATATPAGAAANPYERGPAPTLASIQAARGPFATAELAVQNAQPGFGGGRIYYPTDTSQGTFGAVAILPGFLSSWGDHQWLGHRLASQGFVVIGINTLGPFDQPPARGDQALAALDNLVRDPRVSSRVDPTRLAVAGWSMGGGGSLNAAAKRPTLKAAIPYAPWETTKNWSQVRVPTLVIGGEGDTIAPETTHAEAFYASLGGEKVYVELNDGGHLFPFFENVTQAQYMISWLKRWVDSDTRYDQFLCPGPAAGGTINEYRNTCPLS
jgi:dienelactone hydrolase